MRRFIARCTIAIALTCSSGCATMLAGGPSTVDVDARAYGKNVTIALREEGGDQVSTTRRNQTTFILNKRSAYWVEVNTPGHSPGVYWIGREQQPLVYANAVPLAVGGFLWGIAFVGVMVAGTGGPNALELLIASGLGILGFTGASFAVDFATGNAWRHDRSAITVELVPLDR